MKHGSWGKWALCFTQLWWKIWSWGKFSEEACSWLKNNAASQLLPLFENGNLMALHPKGNPLGKNPTGSKNSLGT